MELLVPVPCNAYLETILASDEEKNFPIGAPVVRSCFYMDDRSGARTLRGSNDKQDEYFSELRYSSIVEKLIWTVQSIASVAYHDFLCQDEQSIKCCNH
ncbi:hypothetical protein CEXT_689301 [Caerostris extrusa]|uniref:Uncharacterized protein n=1 Tax=Caerostris extrusa TaxID=172846 RepID=A0AAV4RUN7_CAEEX|nr:hypothetical protein CEXT_689301 [Caerostris extrusa]